MIRIARRGTVPPSAERRVLDEAGGARAMTWVMAIMLFLTLLAAAAGLATAQARALLERQLAGRMTVQVAGGDRAATAAAAARAVAVLRSSPGVARTRPVAPAELARLLRPWLGADAADPELPMPAMIDVDLTSDDAGVATRVTAAVLAAVPDARVDRHEAWMSPVAHLMGGAVWLAAVLVLLMAGATAAVVVLAARAGLETHSATIGVMHMLGSTDAQIARLFQRRIALDAAVGGAVGALAAAAVVLSVARQLATLGSDLLGGLTLSTGDWVALAATPLLFVLLATLAARFAVTATLRRAL
ncbi:MAG: cell division protein FtsX [Janthinobacterium lividum]